MGLSDRDYVHDDYSNERKHRRRRRSSGRSAVITIIFINFALWFANGLFFENNDLTNALLLRQVDEETAMKERIEPVSFLDPAMCYRYVTCGFVHSPQDVLHILFNMFALLMFGYGMMLGVGPGGFGFVRGENVESRLGRLEFTAFYLLTIIAGGVVFAISNYHESEAGVLGASGGVSGVVILFAWLYPRKMLLFMGFLPMPMWAIGGLIVCMDAAGAAGTMGGNIAYSVHLVGAACGTLYYFIFLKQGLKLTGWLETSSAPPRKQPKKSPKMQVHVPEEPMASEDDFNRRLDTILKRYGEVGESGLSAAEREFLREASRKFAEKHRKR